LDKSKIETPKIKKIVELATKKNIKINYTAEEILLKFSGNRNTDGVILRAERKIYIHI